MVTMVLRLRAEVGFGVERSLEERTLSNANIGFVRSWHLRLVSDMSQYQHHQLPKRIMIVEMGFSLPNGRTW